MKKYIRKYSLNESIFSTINAESCYWAGFIAADGTIYDNMVKIVLHKKDIKHVELFLNFVMGNYKIKNTGKYCEVCIYSKQIVDDLLHNFNVFKKKSLTIDLPDLSSCMIRHYIRGYFDGDGCITWNKKQNLKISVVSGSFKQIENIKKVVCKQTGIELLFYTYTKKRKNSVYVIEKTGRDADLFLDWLYRDCKYYLERKFNKAQEYKEIRKIVEIKNANKIYEKKFCGRNKEIFDLIKLGKSRKEVAAMFNVCVSNCNYIIKEFEKIGETL